jgi:hypothetical protein
LVARPRAISLDLATAVTEDAAMAEFDAKQHVLVGVAGVLDVPEHDEITRKLAMLIEGECEGLGPIGAARKFGFSKQRYFQLRAVFRKHGAPGLLSQKRGPKTHYRRTAEIVRQVIRYRFLDPDASVEVIAQKLRQSGWEISIRSVQRVIEEYGIQKKTLSVPAQGGTEPGNPANRKSHTVRAVRSRQSRARRPSTPGR